METTDLGFEYFLAERLRMTVAAVREMSSWEYEGWKVHYGRKAQQEQLARLRGA